MGRWSLKGRSSSMMIVVGDNKVESDIIKVVTEGINESVRGIQDKDAQVYITGNGGVR